MQIASRKLTFTGPPAKYFEIRIFAPERECGGGWICRYEVDWPEKPRTEKAGGLDSMQALVLALNMIGSEIYTSEYHKAGQLSLEGADGGYGFPVPNNLRDLLIGDDAKYL